MSHYCCKRCGLRYDDCSCGPLPAPAAPVNPLIVRPKLPKRSAFVLPSLRTDNKMNAKATAQTKVAKPPKSTRYYFEAFEGPNKDWYLRTKSPNGNKISVSEGYVGAKSKIKRAAQSVVNGFAIPVARLNIVVNNVVVESWTLRPQKPAEKLEVAAQTPNT